ncbi:RNA-directed DNA polymerase [Prevotella koreensis]|uniref:RNA-directed DNA polymerase n=1 Tax=Prevotella koreensis TaxID=2490854 RepID=A0A3S0PUX9_9BACT|nr:RNA-directed DNA polymerase [Prevotella koreensis]RUL59595.1 RNA-directed DNA polymerase [Prevotella koreensis]
MTTITTAILKTAFRKLLTATYFDKTDMVMRYRVATFAKKISSKNEEKRIFNNLLSVAKGNNDNILNSWLDEMELSFYPKKVSNNNKNIDNHVITNIPPHIMKVEKLLVKANIPVELCILDVAWLLLYGFKVDSKLYSHSYGNRMDLTHNNSRVRNGNALFIKYHGQYKKWWGNGIKEANKHIKNKENITIINFDISNCYHSIDFDFNEFFSYYDKYWPDDKLSENMLTKAIVKVYQRYWEIVQETDIDVFKGNNDEKRTLPLTLMSAHVLANWYLSPLDDFITKNEKKPYYYGRYVDDCMVVLKSKPAAETLIDNVNNELPDLIEDKDGKFIFAFASKKEYKRLRTFELQKDKLYVYRFNCLLSQSSLDEFAQGQMERSSEFRFLTDDVDTGNVNLEFVTLVNTFDSEEEPGRRFNILEENRYKLAIYLAKLASRLAKYGKDYKHFEEVEKVYNYFKEGYLIKHYQLWERLMTVFVLADREEYVSDFVKNVQRQIELLESENGLFGEDKEAGMECLKKSLTFHLEQSRNLAMSLHRVSQKVDSVYLETFMVRMHYNQLPLQEFADRFTYEGVRLTINNLKYREELQSYRWMPYYVKYYAIVSALSLGEVYKPDYVYKRAFEIYCELNHVEKKSYWKEFCRPPKSYDDKVTEFNVDFSPTSQKNNQQTVSVVEMDIKEKDAIDVIDKYGIVDTKKFDIFDNILDQITKIYKTDIFVLPELALPIYELMGYCLYSANHEVAFVSGIEYVVRKRVVYNYVITCLPITLFGQRDAVPVIRLKNHYAPDEIDCIVNKKKLKIPNSTKAWQNLYHWHGHVFTSYYCFELASIVERSYFYSKIDAIYSPVFNKDTYYFNNIAESMARDMHCYFILSNVSHFGDSRVTMPGPHMKMDLLKAKGGNTVDNKAVVLSATLDIDSLRHFQKKRMSQQKNDKNFKKTPPDYKKKMVDTRSKKRFIY